MRCPTYRFWIGMRRQRSEHAGMRCMRNLSYCPRSETCWTASCASMPVLCLAGTWCGDCIQQCPVFDHFAQATGYINLRFVDRDAVPLLRDALAINGGHRVPVVVFLSEDWFEVARYGERTLSIYRRLASEQLGSFCPTGLVPPAPRSDFSA